MSPTLLIDGDGLAHRAFHGGPSTRPNKAIDGFFGMVARVWARERAGAVYVGWDTLGVDTYRSELLPTYQAGRFFDPDLVNQLNALPELCTQFGFGVGKAPGFEADDLVATATRHISGSKLILTSDKDYYQLVDAETTVLSPQTGGKDPERITPEAVVAKLGVLPEQVIAFKALAGDPSDGIPGLKGVGPKTAAGLLLQHGDLDGVLASWSKPEEIDLARTFQKVATMRFDAPYGGVAEPTWAAGCDVLRNLGLDAGADRILALVRV